MEAGDDIEAVGGGGGGGLGVLLLTGLFPLTCSAASYTAQNLQSRDGTIHSGLGPLPSITK